MRRKPQKSAISPADRRRAQVTGRQAENPETFAAQPPHHTPDAARSARAAAAGRPRRISAGQNIRFEPRAAANQHPGSGAVLARTAQNPYRTLYRTLKLMIYKDNGM
jgi:hypothetical protein